MSPQPSVRLERLGFAHGDATPIVVDADVCLPAGWTGLTGENGAGKTTLLRLLGAAACTTGRWRIRGGRVLT